MASFKKFEDIESWQLALKITQDIYKIYQETELRNDFKLWNQINASSGSVMDNIAEGFDRGVTKSLSSFYLSQKVLVEN